MQIKIIEQQPREVTLRFERRFASVVDDEHSDLDDIECSSAKIEKIKQILWKFVEKSTNLFVEYYWHWYVVYLNKNIR